MRYIDTNVLVRIITGDIPEQARQALQTIEEAGKDAFCIDVTVLVEVCFVLQYHSYRMTHQDIADALLPLIAAPQISSSAQAVAALELYRKHDNLDFTDCLLYVLGGKGGVFRFDKDLIKTLL